VTSAQRAREGSRDALRLTMLDRFREGCQVIGFDYRYLYVNDALAAQGRRAREQLLGRTMMECYPGIEHSPMFVLLRETMEQRVEHQLENEFIYPDGGGAWFDLRLVPVPEGVFILSLDITARKRAETEHRTLEERLHHSQRLETVGRLAGGVAHDFNNLLSIILGHGELAQGVLPPGHEVNGHLQQILNAAQSAARLTRQLLAFSRRQVLKPERLDLNREIADRLDMIRRLIGSRIELRTVPHAGLGPVTADPGQLEQVLLNLVVNARDAMPDGGRLTLRTAEVELDELYRQRDDEIVPGRYAMLAVEDTGIGMDAATRERVFEPFFTTKEPGKGTGLGMATVHGIVKQSGGTLWIYSEPGRGTVVKLYLPLIEADSDAPPPTAPAPAARTPARGRVLLVEDDEGVRRITGAMLTKAGYTVLSAAGPREALGMLARDPGGIDALLTDVVMPDMNGPELAAKMLERCPDLRVVYMSGYPGGDSGVQDALSQGAPFLEKPFGRALLLETLGRVLA